MRICCIISTLTGIFTYISFQFSLVHIPFFILGILTFFEYIIGLFNIIIEDQCLFGIVIKLKKNRHYLQLKSKITTPILF